MGQWAKARRNARLGKARLCRGDTQNIGDQIACWTRRPAMHPRPSPPVFAQCVIATCQKLHPAVQKARQQIGAPRLRHSVMHDIGHERLGQNNFGATSQSGKRSPLTMLRNRAPRSCGVASCPANIQLRTTRRAGSVIAAIIRACRSCGASPDTIASALAIWLTGHCAAPSMAQST